MAANYYNLPAAQMPKNALLDFSQLNEGISNLRKGWDQNYDNETNRLLGVALKTGDYGAMAGVAAERGNPEMALKLTQFKQSQSDRAEDREWRMAERTGNIANAALMSGDPAALANAHREVLGMMGKDADRLDPAVRSDPKAFLTLAAHKAGKYIDPTAQRLKGLQLQEAELSIEEKRRKLASGGGEIKQHEGKFYRVQPDGTVTLLPVQGAVAGGASQLPGTLPGASESYKDPAQVATVAAKLRGDFEQAPAYKNFATVSPAYSTIKAALSDESGAGDMSGLYSYIKLLDPGSAVREGEVATAQNTNNVPDGVLTLYNRALSGQFLAPKQRADFRRNAENIYKNSRDLYKKHKDTYRGIAQRFYIDDRNVVYDIEDAAPEQAYPPAVTVPQGQLPQRGVVPQQTGSAGPANYTQMPSAGVGGSVVTSVPRGPDPRSAPPPGDYVFDPTTGQLVPMGAQ